MGLFGCITGEDGGMDGGTVCDCLVGVDALVGVSWSPVACIYGLEGTKLVSERYTLELT